MNKIIILEEFDFLWSREEIDKVVALHNSGRHINQISKVVKRKPAEVLLALIHVAVKKEVELRPL